MLRVRSKAASSCRRLLRSLTAWSCCATDCEPPHSAVASEMRTTSAGGRWLNSATATRSTARPPRNSASTADATGCEGPKSEAVTPASSRALRAWAGSTAPNCIRLESACSSGVASRRIEVLSGFHDAHGGCFGCGFQGGSDGHEDLPSPRRVLVAVLRVAEVGPVAALELRPPKVLEQRLQGGVESPGLRWRLGVQLRLGASVLP